MTETQRERYKTNLFLLLLTAATLGIHGYHPFAEDAEIYLPGIERILNPKLFPAGQEFFSSHASLTLFPNLVAWSLRLTHLPFELGLLLWHLGSIFLLLRACLELSRILFPGRAAQWAAMCLVASLLTIPVAGTALYLMDQYLNPRNLAAFAAVFAVARTLEKKYLRAALWLVAAACVHPLMWFFPFSFCGLWLALEKFDSTRKLRITRTATAGAGIAGFLLGWIPLAPRSAAYHAAARLHAYFYIQDWAWYELLGAVAPLVLLWWLGRVAQQRGWALLARTCRAFIIYGAIYFLASLVVDLPARFESLARLQPMRSLHLLYVFLLLTLGGFLGEYVLQGRIWRSLLLFVPLAIGMYTAQRSLFPASAHLELPGRTLKNPWAQAFEWIRGNTPVDAVFVIDPEYMQIPGEDHIGFRCLARRSHLADNNKDNGVVSMFPQLAEKWAEQVQAQTPWKGLQAPDFARLKEKYGADWVVLQQPGVGGLDCLYQNQAVQVCRVP